MINEKMEKALNNQFNVELSSAYLYLDMHTFLEKKGLFGFANWMCIQVKEELEHAKGIYDYILERGGNVCLHPIEKPAGEWDCVVKVFEAVLAHEKRVTGDIFNLMDIAEEVNDKSTEAFLDWYIKEQVENPVFYVQYVNARCNSIVKESKNLEKFYLKK